MQFTELGLKGAYLIEIEPIIDHRGYFARAFCVNEFSAHGLATNLVQASTSFSKNKGLIRGMHFQAPPYQETKIVRCTQGAIFDVIIDLRNGSPTYNQWVGVELSAKNCKALYVPKGFAHGFQALEDNTQIFYMMDEFHHPEVAREISPHSQSLQINWPIQVIHSTLPALDSVSSKD